MSGRIRTLVLTAAFASTLIAGAYPTGVAASTCEGWTGLQPPNPSSTSYLYSVATLSPCDAWAVGSYSSSAYLTLIEHWNGSVWTQETSLNPGGTSNNNVLSGVAAVSPSNVWAVGSYFNGTANQTLIEHWNGSAWKQVTSKNPGGSSQANVLLRVAATSPSNAWAVGVHYPGTVAQTLIEQWNGTAWKVVPSQNPGGSIHDNAFNTVAATSSNAWAVGGYATDTGEHTLIERWNGRSWRTVSAPNPGGSSYFNSLAGVAAVSSSNAWAVGFSNAGTMAQTLIEHWNGKSWTRVSSPSPGSDGASLDGVAASSSTNVWAVGNYLASPTISETLAIHCC